MNTDATNQTENSEGRDWQNPISILPQDPHRSLHSSSMLYNTQEPYLPGQRNYSQQSQENTQTGRMVEIPEFEDDWKEDQFNDADA